MKPHPPAGGLRERKKRKTRAAIQREALRLFLEQGYDETTIEQIAEAAEVSPSTFFNYFPTKEDVVLTDDFDPLFVSRFAARPGDEPISVALRRTFAELMTGVTEPERELMLARGRLTMGVPALRARVWDELERGQDLLADLLARRTGVDRGDFELRVVATAVVGAMYTASIEWQRSEGRADLADLVDRALRVIDVNALLQRVPHTT